MRHSWGSRGRDQERDSAVAAEANPPPQDGSSVPQTQDRMRYWKNKPELEKDVLQASDKLVTTVKSGVQSVLDMLSEMEGRINKQQALREQQQHRQRLEGPGPLATPSPVPATMFPADSSNNTRTLPPTYTQPSAIPTPNDPTISHIIAAIEKMNARLDALSPPDKNTPPTRLV